MAFNKYNNLMEWLMWFEVSPWQLVQDIFTKFYGQLDNKNSSIVLHDKEEELGRGLQAKYPEVGWKTAAQIVF